MITVIRGLAAGVVLAGAAVGLAGPASAEPPSGNYTATMLDAGASGKQVGATVIMTATPCGPDCTHIAGSGGNGWELHQQGGVWTGTDENGTQTLDNNLILTINYTDGDPPVVIGLTKNG